MDDITVARALHLFGVVLWIGGVAFVTTVLLPAVRDMKDGAERVAFFDRVERRFAWQARATTLLVGLTGLHMVHAQDLWHRFTEVQFWWMHAMVLIWAAFTAMLFVVEPLYLHQWFETRAAERPAETFILIQRLHWLLLTASLVTVLGAMAGAHG